MHPRRSEDDYTRQILTAIASGEHVTQRSLAVRMGVALGLTNLLIRRLVAKGYVRLSRINHRQVRYLMTPVGLEALGRATRVSLANTVHLFTETREQIRSTLTVVSRQCAPDEHGQKRIVFYGAGDVAEIAYVSLQSTDLVLGGVVDDRRTGHFFSVPIRPSSDLTATHLAGEPYSHVVVTSLSHADTIRERVQSRGILPDRVSYI